MSNTNSGSRGTGHIPASWLRAKQRALSRERLPISAGMGPATQKLWKMPRVISRLFDTASDVAVAHTTLTGQSVPLQPEVHESFKAADLCRDTSCSQTRHQVLYVWDSQLASACPLLLTSLLQDVPVSLLSFSNRSANATSWHISVGIRPVVRHAPRSITRVGDTCPHLFDVSPLLTGQFIVVQAKFLQRS